MTLSVRPIAGLLLAPAVPAVVLAAYSLPSNFQMVLPLAKAVLLYGYASAFLVALPILVVFSGYFSRKPLAVIPLAGVTGALAGASPFVLVALNEGINLSDWPLLIALLPLLAMGTFFGMLSGLVYWLMVRSSRSLSR